MAGRLDYHECEAFGKLQRWLCSEETYLLLWEKRPPRSAGQPELWRHWFYRRWWGSACNNVMKGDSKSKLLTFIAYEGSLVFQTKLQ